MIELNKHHTGLAAGLFTALCHAAWSFLVAAGAAGVVLEWLLWLHFLTVPITVHSFRIVPAVLLTSLTFVSGYALGWLFASIWNAVASGEGRAQEVRHGKNS